MEWLTEHGTRIGAIVLLALIAIWIARRLIPRAVRATLSGGLLDQLGEPDDAITLEEQAKRSATLTRVLVRSVEVLALLLAATLVLGEAGFELGPLIAGAGIVGIAIGFGAQTLVRDVIGGIVVLLENQYAVGDVVQVAGLSGSVEAVNLRRTILRDLDGVVHTVPNGEIRTSSNLTRGFARVNLDVAVGYGEDLDRVRETIDRVGRELADDPDWSEKIIEPPTVLRVNAFGESSIDLKVLGTVRPTTQWEVAGELRARLKRAFDAEGIEIPYARRVVVMQPSSRAGATNGD